MKNLMIVESPTKVKSIEKFLGPDFKVVASVGHVRDLVSSARKGIDVDQGFKPVWKVSNNKKTVIDDIKKFTKDADVIYFATDPDREGEAISKHLYDILDKAKILKEKEDVDLSSSLIQPVAEIKSIGEFKVILNLHSEIESSIKIKVIPEELVK